MPGSASHSHGEVRVLHDQLQHRDGEQVLQQPATRLVSEHEFAGRDAVAAVAEGRADGAAVGQRAQSRMPPAIRHKWQQVLKRLVRGRGLRQHDRDLPKDAAPRKQRQQLCQPWLRPRCDAVSRVVTATASTRLLKTSALSRKTSATRLLVGPGLGPSHVRL